MCFVGNPSRNAYSPSSRMSLVTSSPIRTPAGDRVPFEWVMDLGRLSSGGDEKSARPGQRACNRHNKLKMCPAVADMPFAVRVRQVATQVGTRDG